MIKAIVFDLGGVFFSEGKSVLIRKLPEEYDNDTVLKILQSPQSIALRKGLFSDIWFWNWVKSQLPPKYNIKLIKQEWYDSYILDEDILKLVQELQGKYRLIIFSGNIKSRIDYLENKYHFRRLFDQEIYSFDYHLNKPDIKFIRIMIRESRVRPDEIMYIDDNAKDALPAQKGGVNVFIYSYGKIQLLRKQLQQLGVHL